MEPNRPLKGLDELGVAVLIIVVLWLLGLAYAPDEMDLAWYLDFAWKAAVLLLLVDIWRRTRKAGS